MKAKIIGIFIGLIFLFPAITTLKGNAENDAMEEIDVEGDIAAGIDVMEPSLFKIDSVPTKKCFKICFNAPMKSIIKGKTIYVDDDFVDDPAHHKWNTIEEGLLDAEDGDIIRVYDGIYHEHVVINKSISLIGNGSTSIIDGDNVEWKDVIYVFASGVTIDGFKIIEAGDDAIEVEGWDNTVISNCEFENNIAGITFSCSSNNVIQNCVFINNSYGIFGYESTSNQIESCDFYSNSYAIYLSDSEDNIISSCNFEENAVGIYFDDAPTSSVMSCQFINNSYYGIYGHHAEDLDMENCAFINNQFGFYAAHGGGSVLRNNVFNDNIYNFGNWGTRTSDFEWDVDTSNTINGKPIYYIVGQSNMEFNETMDIGFLALVSCDDIVVKNVNLSNNFNGLVLVDTTDSLIMNCEIYNCYWTGILLGRDAKYNRIEGCSIHNVEERAIYLYIKAENNVIANSSIYSSNYGIISFAKYDEVFNCSIHNCDDGIRSIQIIEIRNCSLWENHMGVMLNAKQGTALENNTFWDNEYHIGLHPTTKISDFYMNFNNNVVDGKTAYYVIGQSNMEFNETMDIGFLCLIECDNITVRNVTITNNYNGIILIGTTNSKIINCTVHGCYYAISIASYSSNNIVKDCKAYDNSHGIFLHYSSGNTVLNCSSYNNVYGIWIHFCPLPANILRNNSAWNNEQNFVMRGGSVDEFKQDIDTSNTADGKPVYHIIGQSGLIFDGVPAGWLCLVECNNIVVKNMIFSNTDQALLLVNTSNSLIMNCTAYATSRGFSFYYNSNNNVMENCISHDNGYGIYFYKASYGALIKNCEIYSNGDGIYCYQYSTDHVIENCTFHDNGEGILLYYHSDDNSILNCTFYNNAYAIDLYSRDESNEIIGCKIYDNDVGIDLYYYAKYAIINDCNISHNIMGIRLYKASYNLITDCNMTNNYYAIYSYTSSNDNSIYGNNFIDNAVYRQVRDECSNNWDNGYPFAGNYWSDYKGKDEYRGENQDIPGSDGIGDTPYIIIGGCPIAYSQDRYPLMYYVGIDKTPPITVLNVGEPHIGKYVSSKTLFNFTAFDYQSGVNKTYYRIWCNGSWTPWMEYTKPFNLSEECKHYIEFYSVDNAGNVEEPYNETYYVDNTAESKLTIELSHWKKYITPYTEFTIWADDGICAVGNIRIHFSIEGPENSKFYYMGNYYPCNGEWYVGINNTPVAFQIRDEDGFAPNGAYKVRFYAEDILGNIEHINIEIFTIDIDPPQTTLSFDGTCYEEWISPNTLIKLDAFDEGSGVRSIRYKIDNGAWKDYSDAFNIAIGGMHTIYYYSKDKIGNEEEVKSSIAYVDEAPPSSQAIFDFVEENGVKWMVGKYIELKANDGESGVSMIYYRIDDGEWIEYTEPIEINGLHTIYFYAEDMVGNAETIRSIKVGVDESPPQIEIEMPDSSVYIFGREVMPLPSFISFDAIVIGSVRIKATAYDECGTEEMKLYINNEMKEVGNEIDFTWNEFAFGKSTIKIEATDKLCHGSTEEIELFVINLAL